MTTNTKKITDHNQTMRRQIGNLHAQLKQCAQQDALIEEGAKERMQVVQKRMKEIRKNAVTKPEYGQEYLQLVKERAALARVLGGDS